jgi:cyanophycin synthetase
MMVVKGDCTGPVSAEYVLRDPTVDFAVLETARGGLLRAGLAFDHCDVGIVTNVAADHLGLKGIHTLDQLARVKSVIPEAVFPHGYAILNADDDLVYAMRKDVKANLAFFSMDENNPRIMDHMKRGGLAAVYENGFITISKGGWKNRITKAINVPLTYGGRATFMIQNILPAVLAGYVQGFSLQDIKMSLESFQPSPSQTPGRLNLFNFHSFDLLLDYAHNPAGLRALKKFVTNIDAYPKIGIIAGIGDRREEDNMEIGRVSSEMFDEIIIRQDKNLRGRTPEELIEMLLKGIREHDPNKKITVIQSEKEAIDHAVKSAVKGSLIVLCSDVVPDALAQVMRLKEEEAENLYRFNKSDIPNIEK